MMPTEILNYTIVRQLGNGGMGQVFLAKNNNIDQMVAIKSLHPQFANNKMLRERFKQEAVMLSSLDHPNIVKFLNYVENEHGVFLIMEYVDGMTLEDFINKKNGLIVEKRAYPYMKEILDAFTYAHSHGIVHRDIKPSNIFLNNEGHIKVMDFGIAQIVSEASEENAGMVMGTPEYMSPEQVYGKAIDQRSDIYSLGVLFHQMLTGTAPYNATTISELEIKRRVISEELPRMKSFYPYVSDGIQKIVDKATAKEKEKRYNSCAELHKDLKKLLEPEPVNKLLLFGSIGVAVVLIAAGLGIWDYFRTKVYYYKDYVEYRGVPEGIGELSSSEVSNRELSYRFEYSKYKLRRLTIVNSEDRPINVGESEHTNVRFPDVYFYYSDNGNIDYKKVYNEYGRLVYKMDYDENLRTATFKYDDEFGTMMTLAASTTDTQQNMTDMTSRSRITRYLLFWDEETGLLTKELYAAGEDNTLASDQDNIYGREYEYDKNGHIVKMSFLGPDQKVKGNSFGLAIKKYTYDEDDNWTSIAYYSADGKPSHDGNNVPMLSLSYDEYGNRIQEFYTSLSGTPALHREYGCSGVNFKYEDGKRVSVTTINAKQKPILCRYGWSTIKYEYNENGYPVKTSYYDLSDHLTLNKTSAGSWAIDKAVVDDKGLVLEHSYFGADEKAVEVYGAHKVVNTYDDYGNTLSTSNYGPTGRSTLTWDMYSIAKYTYDDYHRLIQVRYHNIDGNLCVTKDNTAGFNREYDKKGNIVCIQYVGVSGNPALCSDGYSSLHAEYDENGNITYIEYKDQFDKPCMCNDGFARKEFVYESKTLSVSQEKYLDVNGNMLFYMKYEYDSRGNIISQSKHAANGSLYSGTAVIHSEYDENNRETLTYATDLNNNKINVPGTSYCQIKNKYDENGNLTEKTFLAANGMAAVDGTGAYKRIQKYNEIGLVIYEKNLGLDGNPTKINPEGKVVYDNCGNILELTCYDGYGSPINGSDGWHKQSSTYDDNNQLVTRTFTDLDGKLVMSKENGYSKYVVQFDKSGKVLGVSYYNELGKVFSTGKYNYDNNGQFVDVTYYDDRGMKVNNSPQGSGNSDWRTAWTIAKGQLPLKLADDVIITAIDITTDGLDVNLKLTSISKADIGTNMSELEKFIRPVYDKIKKETAVPSSVNFDMYIYDKNDKFLLIF